MGAEYIENWKVVEQMLTQKCSGNLVSCFCVHVRVRVCLLLAKFHDNNDKWLW